MGSNGRSDIVIDGRPPDPGITIPAALPNRHAVIYGQSGGGKSYFAYRLALEQLKDGCSLVVIDPKRETVRMMRGACREAGLEPEDVVTIDARDRDDAPAFNPLVCPNPGAGAALVYDAFNRDGKLSGDRMGSFFAQAVQLAAWHGLSVLEIPRVLRDHEFREDLMDREPEGDPGDRYWGAVSYFQDEYPRFRDAERDGSVGSVCTKFTDLTNSNLFIRMFSARENALDFPGLFRRPSAVLVSVDLTGGTDLDSDAARVLASLVVRSVLASATDEAPVPCVLMADEFHNLGNSMEEAFRDVVNVARARHVRLIVSTPHAAQIPQRLREDMATNAALRAYFKPSDEDAADAGVALANAEQSVWHAKLRYVLPQEATLHAGHLRETKGEPIPIWDGDWPDDVDDYLNRTLVCASSPPAKLVARGFPSGPPPADPLPLNPDGSWRSVREAIRRFCSFAWETVPPVYADMKYADHGDLGPGDPLDWNPCGLELCSDVAVNLPAGCTSLVWRGGVGRLRVQLLAAPPAGIWERWRDRWRSELLSLGRGEAVIRIGTGAPRRVRIPFGGDPSRDAPADWVRKSADAHRAPEVPRPVRVRRDWSVPQHGSKPGPKPAAKEPKAPREEMAPQPRNQPQRAEAAPPREERKANWADVPDPGTIDTAGLGLEPGFDDIVP